MTSEASIYWDSGLTVSHQALPQTRFRVTFDVTRRLGRDRQWLPLTVGPRTSSETDRALPAAGRLGAASSRESAASSCFVPAAGGAGAGGVEEETVVLDRAAHFCGEAVVAVCLGSHDLAAVFGDRGAEGVA